MHTIPDVPAELVRELVDYNPDTGKFRWKRRDLRHFVHKASWARWNGKFADKEAFRTSNCKGHLTGRLLWPRMLAHRVAWVHYYGEWPDGLIDHINGDGRDNRIANLRLADHSENGKNSKRTSRNKSGMMGVYGLKNGRWLAYLQSQGKYHYLGTHDTFEQACAVRLEAQQKFGFSPLHGR